jgi:hypothetical protein
MLSSEKVIILFIPKDWVIILIMVMIMVAIITTMAVIDLQIDMGCHLWWRYPHIHRVLCFTVIRG